MSAAVTKLNYDPTTGRILSVPEVGGAPGPVKAAICPEAPTPGPGPDCGICLLGTGRDFYFLEIPAGTFTDFDCVNCDSRFAGTYVVPFDLETVDVCEYKADITNCPGYSDGRVRIIFIKALSRMESDISWTKSGDAQANLRGSGWGAVVAAPLDCTVMDETLPFDSNTGAPFESPCPAGSSSTVRVHV